MGDCGSRRGPQRYTRPGAIRRSGGGSFEHGDDLHVARLRPQQQRTAVPRARAGRTCPWSARAGMVGRDVQRGEVEPVGLDRPAPRRPGSPLRRTGPPSPPSCALIGWISPSGSGQGRQRHVHASRLASRASMAVASSAARRASSRRGQPRPAGWFSAAPRSRRCAPRPRSCPSAFSKPGQPPGLAQRCATRTASQRAEVGCGRVHAPPRYRTWSCVERRSMARLIGRWPLQRKGKGHRTMVRPDCCGKEPLQFGCGKGWSSSKCRCLGQCRPVRLPGGARRR